MQTLPRIQPQASAQAGSTNGALCQPHAVAKTSRCGMEGEGDSVQRSAADNLKVFESGELLSKDGPVSARDALKGKYVGVYYSASWCPPCQRFTPKLVEAYSAVLKDKNLEIVFVSAGSASFARCYPTGTRPSAVTPCPHRPRRAGLLLLLLQDAVAGGRLRQQGAEGHVCGA